MKSRQLLVPEESTHTLLARVRELEHLLEPAGAEVRDDEGDVGEVARDRREVERVGVAQVGARIDRDAVVHDQVRAELRRPSRRTAGTRDPTGDSSG